MRVHWLVAGGSGLVVGSKQAGIPQCYSKILANNSSKERLAEFWLETWEKSNLVDLSSVADLNFSKVAGPLIVHLEDF